MTYKDLLANFRPLTTEEQKDLLFIILDCLDFYDQKAKQLKPSSEPLVKEDLDKYLENFQHRLTEIIYYNQAVHAKNLLESLVPNMTEDANWQKEVNLPHGSVMRKVAHAMRVKYEEDKKNREA